jgi:hypothetical protein
MLRGPALGFALAALANAEASMLDGHGPSPRGQGKRAIRGEPVKKDHGKPGTRAKRRNFMFDRPARGNAGLARGNRIDHHRFYRQQAAA